MRTLTYLALDKDIWQLQRTDIEAFAAHVSGRLLTSSAVSLVAAVLGTLASSVAAQGASEGFVNPKDIKWGAAPPRFPRAPRSPSCRAIRANRGRSSCASWSHLTGKDHHYLVAKSEAVIQINGNGPFDVTYINPYDDHQKASTRESRASSHRGWPMLSGPPKRVSLPTRVRH